jgi:hypothetical protein
VKIGDNVEIQLTLVTDPVRTILIGLSSNSDAAALDVQNARNIAASLNELADRLEALGGASPELFNVPPTEKPS